MSKALVHYESLFGQFLSGMMPVEEFQATFLERFKNEEQLDGVAFNVLDQLFGDVDSFTADQRLLAENPDFYLDEAKLREKVRSAADRLAALKT
jgi:hypothetical protein